MKNFSRYFNTLTILTFTGAGIALIFALLYTFLWQKMGPILEIGDEKSEALKQSIIKAISLKQWNKMETEQSLQIYFDSMRNYYLFAAFTHFSAILGVLMLRYRKTYGFWLYVASHLLFITAPFLLIYNFKPVWGELLIFTALAALFIFLYSKVYIVIKQLPQE